MTKTKEIKKTAQEIMYRSEWFKTPLSEEEKYIVSQDVRIGKQYAEDVIKGRWFKLEKNILKSDDLSCGVDYARDVIKGRWEKLEEKILQSLVEENTKISIQVVSPVTRYCEAFGKWPELEKLMIDHELKYLITQYCIHLENRLPEAEKIIAKDPECSAEYAESVINGRFEEAEENIKKCPQSACNYATRVLGKRWSEAEPIILKDSRAALNYCEELVKGEWKELEDSILHDSNLCMRYVELSKKRWPKFEERMLKLKSPHKIIRYLQTVGEIGQELHNKMVMLSFDDKHKEKVSEYFSIIEEKKKRHSKFLKRIKNWLVDHKDKNVEEVLDFIEKDEYNPIV